MTHGLQRASQGTPRQRASGHKASRSLKLKIKDFLPKNRQRHSDTITVAHLPLPPTCYPAITITMMQVQGLRLTPQTDPYLL